MYVCPFLCAEMKLYCNIKVHVGVGMGVCVGVCMHVCACVCASDVSVHAVMNAQHLLIEQFFPKYAKNPTVLQIQV